jgi:triphosphoribosyl-dephospho-CoA synthase
VTDDTRINFIATDAQIACVWEATARKLGNVHPTAHFRDTEYFHFLHSALILGSVFRSYDRYAALYGHGFPLRGPVLGGGVIGHRILDAVQHLRQTIGVNTNLGIVLLLAPLVHAAYEQLLAPLMHEDYKDLATSYRKVVALVLDHLSPHDTAYAYEAIRLANPGGLGDAPEQDVRAKPTVTLLEAMKLAADRDLIARQYANGFADVFDFGVPAFLESLERFNCVEATIIHSQLRWLAEYPDSLIVRKNGPAVAEDVRRRAAEVLRLGGLTTPEGRAAGVALDRHLRSDGNKLNPGTTADLITACLFVALRENKVAPAAPFRWNVPDWL